MIQEIRSKILSLSRIETFPNLQLKTIFPDKEEDLIYFVPLSKVVCSKCSKIGRKYSLSLPTLWSDMRHYTLLNTAENSVQIYEEELLPVIPGLEILLLQHQTEQFLLPVTEQLVFIWFPKIIKVKILWKCIKHLLKLVLKTLRKENVCWHDDYRCWSEQEEPGSNIFVEERLHKVSIPCFGFNDIMRDVDNA